MLHGHIGRIIKIKRTIKYLDWKTINIILDLLFYSHIRWLKKLDYDDIIGAQLVHTAGLMSN